MTQVENHDAFFNAPASMTYTYNLNALQKI